MRSGNYTSGEKHPRSKMTDHEVELVRELKDAGLTYIEIAQKFEVSKSCIAGICQCRRRAVTLYAP